MHLKGSYSGRNFSIGSDGSVQFSKTMYFEPDYPYETQLDLYMCSGFPHIGDPWKFDNDEIHSDITVNFAKQLVCNGVNNEGKLVDEASDLAAQNMEVWVVNATYKIRDGISIGGGSEPISPDPFPSGSTTPSAQYLPENYQIAGAPWEKYPEITLDYSEADSTKGTAFQTAHLINIPIDGTRSYDLYDTFRQLPTSARWRDETDPYPVVNGVGENFDFKSTKFIGSETITWFSRKLESVNPIGISNLNEVKTATGHTCGPHTLKVNPTNISLRFFNWTLDTNKINDLLEDYVEDHPGATYEELSALYTQYYNNPTLVIPYYQYSMTIDYNPEGWITFFYEKANKAFFPTSAGWGDLESAYHVTASEGLYTNLSTVISGVVGLKAWNEIDAVYNKTALPKEYIEAGYVKNATAMQLTDFYLLSSYSAHPIYNASKAEATGFSDLPPCVLSSKIQTSILSGNWPSKLLLF